MGSRASLDSALLALFNEPEERQRRVSPELLPVTLKFTGPVAALEAVGFLAWTVIPNPDDGPWIAAGAIARDRLGELADLPGVLYIEGPRSLRAELDATVPEIQANLVHSGNPSRKGAGVVIGIIDSGIDFNHRNFRNDDGSTRIRGIWDQALQREAGERPPTGFANGAGVEYTQKDIEATLQNSEHSTPFPAGTTKVRSRDRLGHGTHVAGIAAGNGSQSGKCHFSGHYVGVAPLADLLIVKLSLSSPTFGQSNNLLNAFGWIWNHPAVVGNPTATPPEPRRPVVVNLSMGDSLGPHDGTSLVESGLDLFLLQNRGHAVVKSAGNEGATNRHAQVVIGPNGTADVTFKVSSNDTTDRRLEIWYSHDDLMTVTLRAPVPPGGGDRRSSTPVAPDSGAVPFDANLAPPERRVTATINSRTNDPRNGACVIQIALTTDATLPTAPTKAPLLEGEWEIHLENNRARSAPVDLYIDNGDEAPKFTSHFTRVGTITTPGTAKLVATVGAYTPQTSFLFFDSDGDLTSFSSFGPTRDGAPKPTICAPGSRVTSTRANEPQHCCCNCCMDFYADKVELRTEPGAPPSEDVQGTSVAAPHVTGIVALMFEKDPTLRASDILRILRDTARPPEVNHDVLPDSKWGGGRVSALGAVNGVAPVPIAGPSLSPPHLAGTPGPAPAGAQPSRARRRPGVPVVRIGPENAIASARPHVYQSPTMWMGTALQSPVAQRWAALASRHFSEVRGLVNNDRRVAMRWHRLGGPRLLNALGPVLTGTGVLTIRDDPDALTIWQFRAHQFLDVLERLGSTELAGAVRQHRRLLTVDVNIFVDQIFALSTQ